jgi:hypothetical protein
MRLRNSIVRDKQSVIGGILLSLVLLSGGCSGSSFLVSSLASVGLPLLTTLLSSLLTSVIPTTT